MKQIYIIGILAIFVVACSPINTSYEVCNDGQCKQIQISKIDYPSFNTAKLCFGNWQESGARSECEQVPINQLLSKGGTDKKYCNNATYLAVIIWIITGMQKD